MPMGLDEAYLNITEFLEKRKNWHEDKRRNSIEPYNISVNGKQLFGTSGHFTLLIQCNLIT